MESQHQKWSNLAFLAGGALVGYLVFFFGFQVAASFDLEARFQNIDLIIRGLSVAVAALVFLILWMNKTANSFMNEVVAEVVRVTWPTSDVTVKATGLVLILVVLAGLFFGALDIVLRRVLELVL